MEKALQDSLTRVQTTLSRLPPRQTLVISAASASALLFYLARIRPDYRAWYNLGAGGVPHNFIGYIVNSAAYWLIANHDVKSTDCYDTTKAKEPYDERAKVSFLDAPLPERKGETAEVPAFVIPQRQTSQHSPPNIRDAQRKAFTALADKYAGTVVTKPSQQERYADATWLDDSLVAKLPPWAKGTKGELCHIHIDADGSGHCTLSLPDAKEVVEKGWGQRHMLSGVKIGKGWLLSHTFTMVYAPRSEEEVQVQIGIFEAAIKCLAGL